MSKSNEGPYRTNDKPDLTAMDIVINRIDCRVSQLEAIMNALEPKAHKFRKCVLQTEERLKAMGLTEQFTKSGLTWGEGLQGWHFYFAGTNKRKPLIEADTYKLLANVKNFDWFLKTIELDLLPVLKETHE